MPTALAVDLGSASGRVLAGTLNDGIITVTEVHRFAHEAIQVEGALIWDVERLFDEIVCGLLSAVSSFKDVVSVSVDTWGVDFVCLDVAGRRVGPAVAYRDERTTRTLATFRQALPDERFFELTGIAPASINTANQLMALITEQPDLAAEIAQIMFLPDYFAWRLTGELGWSRTIASTSGLCESDARSFCPEVFKTLGIPSSWVGQISDELSIIGPCRIPGLTQLTVVRGGSHDSACAVHALPLKPGVESYFLSSGSWSVLGAMLADPLISPQAKQLGLTNEVRTDGGMRPLFNITGLWIIQECQREWAEQGINADIVELVEQARTSAPSSVLINPDEPCFTAPKGMIERLRQAVIAQGGHHLETPGEIVRLVLESLAKRYARGINELSDIIGHRPGQLNVVGGGSRNSLLCQLTADAAKLPVVAGPAEASTLGSLVAQFETLGLVQAQDRREIVTSSSQTTTYYPTCG